VIVDADGKIKKIYPKVSVTGHVDQVLEDLK
jgi:peroxiredoxin